MSMTISAQSNLYIHTDRDIYQPGDLLHFRLFSDMPSITAGGFSLDLFLIDQDGIISGQYNRILDSDAFADSIRLSGGLLNGVYTLLVKFPNMPIDLAFEKEILIQEFQLPTVLIVMNELQRVFTPGEKIEIPVSMITADGNSYSRKSFQYILKVDAVEIETGKGKTDKQGQATIEIQYPDVNSYSLVSLECIVEQLGNIYSNGLILPSSDLPLLVSFFPEGGLWIDGYDYKVGFTAHSLYGEPINIEGDIVDSDNKSLGSLRTSMAGYGQFAIKVNAAQPLYLKVTEPAWMACRIEMPKINSNGVVLRYSGKDDKDYLLNLINPVADTYMSLVTTVEQFGRICYQKKNLVQTEKEVSIPRNTLQSGMFYISVVNERDEVLAQRSLYHWGNRSQIPSFESKSVAVVDQVFAPKWKSVPSLGDWLNQGPELSKTGIGPAMIETYLLTHNPKIMIRLADEDENEFVGRSIVEKYRRSAVDQYVSELKIQRFFNQHFQSEELEYAKFYTENRMVLNDLGYLPQKMSPEQRTRRQLDQGKSVLSVIKTIRAYKVVNNQLVFRGTADSFNDPGGAVIVIDGVPKGANIQILEQLSPFDVESIKVSASISDIMKYAGMEDTAGVIIIETRKAGGETVKSITGPKQLYSPTILWNPIYKEVEKLDIPETRFKGKLWMNKS